MSRKLNILQEPWEHSQLRWFQLKDDELKRFVNRRREHDFQDESNDQLKEKSCRTRTGEPSMNIDLRSQ